MSSEEVVYRGVKWRRSGAARILWFNENRQSWVVWAPGADSPPLPIGWEPEDEGAGRVAAGDRRGDAMSGRPGLRSPYRIVPIVVALVIVAVAAYQASRPTARATRHDIAAAEALLGRCLARSGGTSEAPDFSPQPVPCSSGSAFVRVVKVFKPGDASPCPSSGLIARVGPALQGEPLECLVPVGAPAGR